MKCNNCGFENPENEQNCQQCGAVLDEKNENQSRVFAFLGGNMLGQDGRPIPMKWFIFLVMFSLPIGAFSNIVQGIQSIAYPSVSAVDVSGLGEISLEALERLNIFTGICMVLMAVFMFYSRRVLASFRKNSLLCINSVYAATGLVNCVNSALMYYIIGPQAKDTVSVMIAANLISSLFMITVNSIYFKKRKHLFVN